MTIFHLVSIVVGALFIARNVLGENLVMPGELVAEAKQLGCTQVSDFFTDRHEMVRPPYAYGYAAGEESNSAVFWCVKNFDGIRTYHLAFMYKEKNNAYANCPRLINWINPPGGLSIYRGKDRKLSDFIFMDEPEQHGPDIYPEHSAVMSSYGGTSAIFYCHRNRWLLLQLD